MTTIDFWYDFASTYSYPAALRIESAAAEREVEVRWRPFLLGPIFADQGWRNSPFNIYPAKGKYMWRDMERICARHGLPFRQPDPFPQNSIHAARVALTVGDDRIAEFSKAVYRAEFGEGLAISERATLAGVLDAMGLHASHVLEQSQMEPIKSKLKIETDIAKRLGIFGAPAFVTDDGEIFWGHDRLEEAFDWAVGKK